MDDHNNLISKRYIDENETEFYSMTYAFEKIDTEIGELILLTSMVEIWNGLPFQKTVMSYTF